MIWFAIPILIQIACVVHVIRSGRNQGWILAIVFFPLLGSAIYFFLEIMPTLGTNRHVRTARAKVVSMVDPERELRAAREAMDVADTAANRIRLADCFAVLGRYAEALPLYREALSMVRGDDPATQVKLARALFETGLAAEALPVIDAVATVASLGEADRRALLRAQILAHLGRREEALAVYADIVTRLPGEEARCRYAALLIETGDRAGAKKILEEVERRMKRLDRTQRAAEGQMYDWAMRELATLRD
jgi:hypothetical protein